MAFHQRYLAAAQCRQDFDITTSGQDLVCIVPILWYKNSLCNYSSNSSFQDRPVMAEGTDIKNNILS
jgi:hypothetical protein